MKKHFIEVVVAGLLLATPLAVLAQGLPTGGSGITPPTGGTGQNCGGSYVCIQNPLGNVNDFPSLIKKLYQGILPIGLAISVLFIVWAGFKFVVAQGNPDKLNKARMTLLNTLIGIGIFLAAWGIATLIKNTIEALRSATGT